MTRQYHALTERAVHPFDRFLARVDMRGPSDCWRWTGALVHGYGHFTAPDWQGGAHRFGYRMWVGPIPEGMDLDHQCHSAAIWLNDDGCVGGECEHRACVNPRHLEPVTRSVNMIRGIGRRHTSTECKRGHDLTGDNLRITVPGGVRICRACERIRVAAYQQRQATAAAS